MMTIVYFSTDFCVSLADCIDFFLFALYIVCIYKWLVSNSNGAKQKKKMAFEINQSILGICRQMVCHVTRITVRIS